MNRTGHPYTNRIAIAVKSAPGLAMLVPQSVAPAAGDRSALNANVTGTRRSVEQSLDAHRDSTELTGLPGLTSSAAGANEGGFEETARVSIRWFVLDGIRSVARSVSFTQSPSEILSEAVVEKSPNASLMPGAVAGSADTITRKALGFFKPPTLEASVGALYADLPSIGEGHYSALGGLKKDAGEFGALLQLFFRTTPRTLGRTSRTRCTARRWRTPTARRSTAASTEVRRSLRLRSARRAHRSGCTITDHFSVDWDRLNFNDPTLKHRVLNQTQPRAFYKNSAPYHLNFRFKL